MQSYLALFFLLTTSLFSISCEENKGGSISASHNIVENALDSVHDTLQYTSGIRCIFLDSKGNYWFGSDNEGACKFNGKVFTYFTEKEGFDAKQVIAIKEDEFGIIWLSTSNGLYSYNGKTIKAVDNITRTYDTWQVTPTDLWFADGKDIVRIDKNKLYTLKNQLPLGKGQNERDLGATGFSKGANGSIWIACYNGVVGFDGKAFTFINDSTMHYDGKKKYIHVRSILADSKNRVWIGNNGVGVLLKEGNTVLNFSEKMNLVKGTAFSMQSPEGTLMHVFAIREDKLGNIWFGDRDTGVWKYDGKEIKNIPINAPLYSLHVWDIYEDKYGNLLIAMAAGGVYKYNAQSFDRIL